MKSKTWLALVLSMAVLFGLSVTAYASEGIESHTVLNQYVQHGIPTSVEDCINFDTTSLTQEEYIKEVQNYKAKDNASEIELICQVYLKVTKAAVRSSLYETDFLIYNKMSKDKTILYRESESRYLRELYKELGWEILEDDISFWNFKSTVDSGKTTAVASIVEDYTYYITDGFDDESFRRREYSFKLIKSVDGWRITEVRTNDVHEDSSFDYSPIDVEARLECFISEKEQIKAHPVIVDDMNKSSISAMQKQTAQREYNYDWTYDVGEAVNYAKAHYQDTSHALFGYNSTNNCQNFASQCVWAGLGGTNSATARPAVSINAGTVSASDFNVWCCNEASTYYDNWELNWAWTYVPSFANLMAVSTSSAEGPYGNSYFTYAVANAEKGNVLYFNKQGTATLLGIDHAMFVTAVIGTAGSRTKDQVKIASHTTATSSAYQVLSSYTDYPATNFARSKIICGFYNVPQP